MHFRCVPLYENALAERMPVILRKKLSRITGMLLALAILSGVATAGAYPQPPAPDDPFEEMKDEYLANDKPRSPERTLHEEAMRDAQESADPFSDENERDSGKTDRYIVKYKDGKEAKFTGKVSSLLEASADILPSIALDTGKLSVAGAENIRSKGEEEAPVKAIQPEIPIRSKAAQNTKLLILSEPMLPSEFAAEIKAAGADKYVEYILPDFRLSLGSLSLSAGENEETDEPEEAKKAAEEPSSEEEAETTGGEESANPVEPESLEPEEDEGSTVFTQQVTVAVIDTGVDTDHEIFNGYLHENAPDTGTNSLSYAHGTHVSGIIVNTAIETGADIKILPIKIFENGGAYTSDIIAAIAYAESCGAQIINCSFGSTAYNKALFEVISASEALFICAVGNNRRDFDETPSYPAGYDLNNIISVASTNSDDGFSYYSNWGPESIDIAARGRDVYSALPGSRYGTQTGTSMSAAYVTGAAAAVLSYEDLDAVLLRARLIYSVDKLSNLQNKVKDGNRLNIYNALEGQPGALLFPDPADDFDVHGYQPTTEESWQLFSSLQFTKISAGAMHSLALASDGSVWAWGDNSFWQLGADNMLQSENPIQVLRQGLRALRLSALDTICWEE